MPPWLSLRELFPAEVSDEQLMQALRKEMAYYKEHAHEARRILEETMVESDDEVEERSELEQEARLRATAGEPMSPRRLALWLGGAFIVAVIIVWIVYQIT